MPPSPVDWRDCRRRLSVMSRAATFFGVIVCQPIQSKQVNTISTTNLDLS